MSENPQETFLAESRELLQDMEDALLQLENSPDDPDLINAMFRAAHTIKGTSGVFSYDDVEAFTHVVENVLENIRGGHLEIDSDLIALMLECNDHIGQLVELAVNEEAVGESLKLIDTMLLERLRDYLEEEPVEQETKEIATQTGQVETIDDSRSVETDNWHISLRFDKDVLKNGMDPLSFLRYLGRLGELVHVTTLCDSMPSLREMDAEENYLGFEVVFSSTASKADIEQVFEFVREDCELIILPPKANIAIFADLIRSLPEDEMRIGDILVKSGALTQRELEDAINYQQNQVVSGSNTTMLGDVLVEKKVVHKEVVDAALNKQTSVKEKKGISSTGRWLRVDSEKLDTLINLVGELVIAEAGTHLRARDLDDEPLQESLSLMNRLVEEIRDSALRLRMVQIGETFNRFQRVVRDVSKELNKDIRLDISGAETELDKTVVEKIADPLMHLVRNAMDHGIESASERQNTDKSIQGILHLNSYHDSGSIVIEVSDDGKGLNRDAIYNKAIEKGLIVEGAVLSDKEIYRLIFEPGFSTAAQITNLSGRGVGMDVVKKNIQALRGTVDVDSVAGQGTTVSIRLPLTLAIIDGFLVRVGESSYVVPLDMVMECIELTDIERQQTNSEGYINLRGEVLPFLRMREVFEESAAESHEREAIVVVQYGGQKAGFVVDELLGEFQTVIKPLGKIFSQLKGISGATILGSGDVAVILDVPNLVQRTIMKSGGQQVVHNTSAEQTVLH